MTVDRTSALPGLLLCACLCLGPLTPRPALAQELLQNGAFEDGAAPWTGCGGVSIVDRNDAGTTAAMVRSGRFAARVGGPDDDTCPWLPAAQLMIVQQVTVLDGATLPLGAVHLVVNGSVKTVGTGKISSTTGVLTLAGAGTVAGMLPTTHVTGSYVLAGNVTLPNYFLVSGGGVANPGFLLSVSR